MTIGENVIVADDLQIKQGCPFHRRWTWSSAGALVDLTNYTARAQFREFRFSGLPTFTLSQIDGITLGGVTGTIDLDLSAIRTRLHTYWRGEYDILLTPPSGNEFPFAEGRTLLDPSVTR